MSGVRNWAVGSRIAALVLLSPAVTQWLSKRLGHQPIVPDLSALGFRLMGGRLLPADSGPAALFMYEDDKGTRLSCYYLVASGAGQTEFQFREQNGIIYWVEDGLAYAIAAKAPRTLLLKSRKSSTSRTLLKARKPNFRQHRGSPVESAAKIEAICFGSIWNNAGFRES